MGVSGTGGEAKPARAPVRPQWGTDSPGPVINGTAHLRLLLLLASEELCWAQIPALAFHSARDGLAWDAVKGKPSSPGLEALTLAMWGQGQGGENGDSCDPTSLLFTYHSL